MTLTDFSPNYDVNKIFNSCEEDKVGKYCTIIATLHCGSTPKNVKTFAYELAKKYDNTPQIWYEKKMAGKNDSLDL